MKHAVFDMKSGKCPGLDGLNSEFYQCFWNEVVDLFYNVVNHIYKEKELIFFAEVSYYNSDI